MLESWYSTLVLQCMSDGGIFFAGIDICLVILLAHCESNIYCKVFFLLLLLNHIHKYGGLILPFLYWISSYLSVEKCVCWVEGQIQRRYSHNAQKLSLLTLLPTTTIPSASFSYQCCWNHDIYQQTLSCKQTTHSFTLITITLISPSGR